MKKLILLLLIVPILGYGQKFRAKVFDGFDKAASLVIISKPSNTELPSFIETKLLLEGFNVYSESVVTQKKKETNNVITKNTNTIEQGISSTKTNYVETEYAVEINFQEYNDTMMGWGVKSANIKITDIKTGKIKAVLTGKKRNWVKKPDWWAEGLINAFIKELK
tara:strand:- start:405 stop:899 length:495 start_codon:yes stop_codon:yes gene_type:complete